MEVEYTLHTIAEEVHIRNTNGCEIAYTLLREMLSVSDRWEIDLDNSERVLTPNFRRLLEIVFNFVVVYIS